MPGPAENQSARIGFLRLTRFRYRRLDATSDKKRPSLVASRQMRCNAFPLLGTSIPGVRRANPERPQTSPGKHAEIPKGRMRQLKLTASSESQAQPRRHLPSTDQRKSTRPLGIRTQTPLGRTLRPLLSCCRRHWRASEGRQASPHPPL